MASSAATHLTHPAIRASHHIMCRLALLWLGSALPSLSIRPTHPPPPPRTGLQIPPQPTTVRGAPLHLNRHPKQPSRVVYASGKYIVVRDLQVNKQ